MATLTLQMDTEAAVQLLIDAMGVIDAMGEANEERGIVEGGFRAVYFAVDAAVAAIDAEHFDGAYSNRCGYFKPLEKEA